MDIDKILEAFDKAHNDNNSKKSEDDIYWSYDSRESVENFVKFYKKVNKLVEATNECPNSEQVDNALDVLYGDNSCDHSKVILYLNSLT